MTTAQEQFSVTVAAITGRLAARHDPLTILRAVTDACATVLSATATGVLAVDPRGGLDVLAASDERAAFLELLQAQTRQGPCPDCIAENSQLLVTDLAAHAQRWPTFVPAALDAGYTALYAWPLRLVDHAVGGLNLFFSAPVALSDVDLRQAQILADLAALGLTQERDTRRIERLAELTLTTLNDRVLISQAVGVLAGSLDLEPDLARARFTEYGERTGSPLRTIARAVIDGTLTATTVMPS